MKVFRASMYLLLASLTAACAGKPVERVVTVYRDVFTPDRLLVGCRTVEWTGGTYRGLAVLAEERGAALRDCAERFAAVKAHQDSLKALKSEKSDFAVP